MSGSAGYPMLELQILSINVLGLVSTLKMHYSLKRLVFCIKFKIIVTIKNLRLPPIILDL